MIEQIEILDAKDAVVAGLFSAGNSFNEPHDGRCLVFRPEELRDDPRLLLADHFLQKFAKRYQKSVEGISPAAYQLLMRNRWPGNVRELENAIERAVVLCDGDKIDDDHLPYGSAGHHGLDGISVPGATMAELEKYAILKTLNEAHMVLVWANDKRTDIRVLDSFVKEVKPAKARKDLQFVYVMDIDNSMALFDDEAGKRGLPGGALDHAHQDKDHGDRNRGDQKRQQKVVADRRQNLMEHRPLPPRPPR